MKLHYLSGQDIFRIQCRNIPAQTRGFFWQVISCQKLSLKNKDHGGTSKQAAVVGYALVVISLQGQRNGGFESRRKTNWHEKLMLNDGFFSFAVARQEPLLSKSILHCYRWEGMSNSRIFYLRELLMPFLSQKTILNLYYERSECIWVRYYKLWM